MKKSVDQIFNENMTLSQTPLKPCRFAQYAQFKKDSPELFLPLELCTDSYGNQIVLKEGITEGEVAYLQYIFQEALERKKAICLVYRYSCECLLEALVPIDRYPMSEGILQSCPDCKKGAPLRISSPLLFFEPINEQYFSLEELTKLVGERVWTRAQEKYMFQYVDQAVNESKPKPFKRRAKIKKK